MPRKVRISLLFLAGHTSFWSLMNYIVLIATLNLVVQLVMLSIIVSGYILMRRTRLIGHGTLMLVAVIMLFFSFLLVMGPALLIIVGNGFFKRPILLSIITIIHASLGATALVTGIWITASWHLQNSIDNCKKRKPIMPYLFVIWIMALIFGITLYLLTYMI
jgi:uncharacterized membrane protein YozB (DUF420 family)